MCGIFGFITNKNYGFDNDERGFVNDMLYMGALRGVDATGICYGTNKGEVQVHKKAVMGAVFMSHKEWDTSYKELFSQGKWVFGHHRAATRGNKDDDNNAHPFIVNDNIVLAQNGSFYGSYKHLADVDVDSHACAIHLEKSESIEKALNDITAAYSFEWWDNRTNCLHLIRNKERPLFIGKTSSGGYAWASEKYMLLAAAARNDIKFEKEPEEVTPGVLWTFNFTNGKVEVSTQTLELRPPFVVKMGYSSGTGTTWTGGGSRTSTPTNTTNNTRPAGKLTPSGALSPMAAYSRCFPDSKVLLPQSELDYFLKDSSEIRKAAKTHRVTIEGVDYCAVNPTDNGCDQYYIFGEVIEDSKNVFTGYHVYWLIEAKDVYTVLEYTAGKMFTAEILTPYVSKQNNRYRLVSMAGNVQSVTTYVH